MLNAEQNMGYIGDTIHSKIFLVSFEKEIKFMTY